MAEETIRILKVDTGEAVKSVNDLKENIKVLKSNLGELEIGSDKYQDTLKELKINQNALKDAMYATESSMEDVAASAKGLNVVFDENNKLINQENQSYNSLVHTMGELKQKWRETTNEAKRAELGEQIAQINQRLKDMDASVGNFQRNVGNYQSATSGLVAKFEDWGDKLKMLPPTLGSTKEQLGKVGDTMKLIGKQPVLTIIGLLAPIISKITDSLKDNETAMDAVKRVMESLQPIFDILTGVIEKVAGGLANVVDWFIELIGQSDGVQNLVSSIMGVGNSILQYLLTPIKTAVEAFKGLGKIIGDVFKGNWSDVKKHAKEAGEGIADAWKDGYSFKANFESGKKAGSEFISGVSDNKGDANAAGKEAGSEFVDGVASNKDKAKDAGKELAKSVQEGFDEWQDEQRALAEEEEFNEAYQAELDAQKAFQQTLNDNLWNRLIEKEEMQQEFRDREVQSEIENQQILKEIAEENAKIKIQSLFAIADATSSVLASLADMYESDEKSAEMNAKKIKALRIAEATINTISGAIGAFMGITKDTGGWGIAAAAAEAAAVMAAGMAQINQIRKTEVSASANSASTSFNANVSAPSVETEMPMVRSVTTAAEEDRLNRMAKKQRVYVVSHDIAEALENDRTKVAESTF